jgi:hypothetical protein
MGTILKGNKMNNLLFINEDTEAIKTNDIYEQDKEKKKSKKLLSASSSISETNLYSKNIDATLDNGASEMYKMFKRYKNNSTHQQTGFLQEVHHTETFNAHAAISRSNVRAELTSPGTRGDIHIKNNGQILGKAESKYYQTPKDTAQQHRGYGDQQRICPSEQLNQVKETSNKGYLKNSHSEKLSRQKVATEQKEVYDHATDRLKKEGIESRPTSSKEAKEITQKVKNKQFQKEDLLPDFKTSIKDAGLSGARTGSIYGAVFSAAGSSYQNIKSYKNGEITEDEMLENIAKDTIKGTCDGALKGAIGSMTKVTALHASKSVANPVLKSALRSNAPIAIGVGLVEVGYKGAKYLNGELTEQELGEEVIKVGVTTGTTYAGTELGALIGTAIFPGVGTVVGGFLGGLLGFGIGSEITR